MGSYSSTHITLLCFLLLPSALLCVISDFTCEKDGEDILYDDYTIFFHLVEVRFNDLAKSTEKAKNDCKKAAFLYFGAEDASYEGLYKDRKSIRFSPYKERPKLIKVFTMKCSYRSTVLGRTREFYVAISGMSIWHFVLDKIPTEPGKEDVFQLLKLVNSKYLGLSKDGKFYDIIGDRMK